MLSKFSWLQEMGSTFLAHSQSPQILKSHTQTANTCNLEEMKDHPSFVCNVDIYERKTGENQNNTSIGCIYSASRSFAMIFHLQFQYFTSRL